MARHQLRFSLLALLGVVTFVAIGAAALARPTPWGARVAVSLLLLAVAYSFIAGMVRRGPWRAFWIGFAVLSSGHVLWEFVLYPYSGALSVTNACLDELWQALGRQRPNPLADERLSAGYQDFITSGVALVTLMVGGLGGLIGLYHFRRNEAEAA
jgi:hypothetical protein